MVERYKEVEINYYEDILNDPDVPLVLFIYASVYKTKSSRTCFINLIAYHNGECIYFKRTKEVLPNVPNMRRVMLAFLRAFDLIFEDVSKLVHIIQPPLVMVSSYKTVEFMEKKTYLKSQMTLTQKLAIERWISLYNPTFKRYNSSCVPFSVLRELAVKDKRQYNIEIMEKTRLDIN